MNTVLITGQLIFRETPVKRDDRVLMMVVGVVAVPTDTFMGEHQYVVVGKDNGDLISLSVLRQGAVDHSATSIGSSLGSLLLQPIWRV